MTMGKPFIWIHAGVRVSALFWTISLWTLTIAASVSPAAPRQHGAPPSSGVGRVEQTIDSILTGLTIQEKIGQLVQYTGGWNTGPSGRTISNEQQALIRAGKTGSLLNVFGSSVTRELQRIAVNESRAKIPLLFGLDVIHGFRTTFPIPLAEAATWNPGAVELSARVSAAEASSAGIHWTFAPMVDIARDPRWGRIAEGSGEDPYLGSLMAAASVRGFQGRNMADPSSIMACAKHYAAYGGAEGGRDYNTVDISERTLRDVYLPPFKAAVDAGAGTLMASFNEIGGVPGSASRLLLTTILREEWKFDGFVVSDWGSIGELQAHGYAATPAEAAERSINAGLDMDMESGCYRDHLQTLVEQGRVSRAVLDEAVRRILRLKIRLGLFTDPYRACTPEREKETVRSAANIQAARSVAREAIVLLRNERNLLPLGKDLKSIAVIGPLADNRKDPLGPWAGPTDTAFVVTLLEGVRAAAPSVRVSYARGCAIDGTDTSGIAAAVSAARQADVVLLAAGESEGMSGEASSRSSLELPGRQGELIRAIQATGTPVVLILMNGRPLALGWESAHVPAIIETWFLGHETGHAIADVLFGDFSPSGRLPVSFPRATGQVPIYYNHKNTGRPTDDKTHYTSRYLDLPSTPLYPFGFGLTYSTFACADLVVETPRLKLADTLAVRVTLKNTGKRTGDEVVQLYVRDVAGSVTRPVRELKAFRRVRLEPGQSAPVTLSVPVADLAFTGLDMQRRVEPGRFKVYVGPNAAEGLEGSFEVLEE
jgi:beta-glucosidase